MYTYLVSYLVHDTLYPCLLLSEVDRAAVNSAGKFGRLDPSPFFYLMTLASYFMKKIEQFVSRSRYKLSVVDVEAATTAVTSGRYISSRDHYDTL